MQTDMFGDFSNAEIGDSAPPMLKSSSSWIAPETIAFNEALHRGSLNDAVAILKPLKVSTLTSVLLQSGFSVPATKDRRSLISLMQSNIIEAAQKRMTGRELLDSRLAAKEAAAQKEGETTSFDPQNYSVAFLPNVKVGDFITCSDGFNYVIQSLKNESFSDKKYITASRPYGDTQNWRKGVSQLSRLTQNEAKLAKERYQVEEKSAIKNNSLALNTAVYFSSVARANSSIYEGGLIRFNGLVYQIDELIGGKYPSEVFIRQIGIESDGFNEIEKISISSGEAIAARQAFFPRVSSFDEVLARSELVYVAQHGPVVDVAIAGDMKPGDVVVDGEGKKYYAFSARFGYLEVYPFKNGKPEVFAGNSIYFHVDPGTAFAYPGRRYDPIFLQKEKSIDKINDLMQYSGIDDAINLLKEKVVENDTGIDGSESLRPRYGSEDRVDGFGGSRSGESLDDGVAQSGGGVAENGGVSGLSGGPSGSGEGHSGEHGESAASIATGDLADTRDQRSAASGGVNDGGLNAVSTRSWTRYELNSLLVTDMTDEQLLQARDVFAGSKREEAVNRQIQKRGLVQSVAQAPSALVEAGAKKDEVGVVRVPSLVDEAIAADMEGAKARYMRLQDDAKATGNTLEQRVALQEQALAAGGILRNMRLAVFQAEDAAVLAIKDGKSNLFDGHAALFPKASAAIASHVASLGVSAAVVSLGWDGLSADAKTEVLKQAGWVTGSGGLNFVGNRLLATPWAGINPVTKATIAKNMAVVEQRIAGSEVEGAGGSLASVAPGREFRDPDTLNALVNPILDGDWFKLGADEWQARNGYSGRGWSLVKDRALHPEVRNLDSQVDFMRAVIEASELARAPVANVDLPDVAGQGPVASLSSSPAASVDRENDVQLLAAARLLSKLTSGSNDIWMLAGRDSVQQRVQVMATLLGREKVTQAEAGVTAIRAEFYKRAGIDTNTTPRGAETEFQNWVGNVGMAAGIPTQSGVAVDVAAQGLLDEGVAGPALASVGEVKSVVSASGPGDGDVVLPADLAAQLQEVHRAVGRGVTQKQALSMRDWLIGEIASGTTNNGGVVARLTPDAVEQRRLSLARVDKDLALFSQALASVGELSPVAAGMEVPTASSEERGNAAESSPQGISPSDLGLGRLDSRTWVDENKSGPDLIREKTQDLGKELALNIAEEAREQDFKPSELPSAIGNWAVDAGVPIEDLRMATLNALQKRSDISDGRMRQIRLAVHPLRMPTWSQVVRTAKEAIDALEAEKQAYESKAAQGAEQAQQGAQESTGTVADQAEKQGPEEAAGAVLSVGSATAQGVDDARANAVWSGLTADVKAEILKGAGFVNSRGDLSFVGARLAGDSWKKIKIYPKAKAGVEAFVERQSAALDVAGKQAVSGDVGASAAFQGPVVDSSASLSSVTDSQKGSDAVRGEYPFGKTDLEDRFAGSVVRVLPTLRGDKAWDGEVSSVFNGGRLITVKRYSYGDREYMPVRISGDRVDVLSLKDSQSVLAEKDPNIGRTWNTIYGKATITAFLFPKREGSSISAVYEYTNESGSLFRIHEDKIEETIQRNEFDSSPEGLAQTAARELAYAKAEADREAMNSKIAEMKAHDEAKLAPFFESMDYPALRIGQAKKALLAPVRLEGKIMKSYEFAEILVGRDLKLEVVMEDRIKPMSRLAFHRADNHEQAAHEQRIKDAGQKKVHYIGGFEVGAFEFAYAGFVRDRLNLERAAGVSVDEPSVADPEIERLFTGAPSVDAAAVDEALTSLGAVEDGVEVTEVGGWSAKTHVLIAADDVSKLRSDDVYRLFEELPKEVDKFDDLRSYIVTNRPDLLSTVVDAIDEVGLPERPVLNSISPEKQAEIVAAQHAKGRGVMDFLSRGNTVHLPSQTRILKLNSSSQIKLGSDGVYVAEGVDKRSSDGVRWVFLFSEQLNMLAAQAGVLDVQMQVQVQADEVASSGPVAGPDVVRSVAEVAGSEEHFIDGSTQEVATDYSITAEDAIGQGGLTEKFLGNLLAIEVLRVLDAEKRHAVPEEKRALARYVGWGGLKGVFEPGNKQWEKQRGQLRAVLSDAEWDAASSSQLNAHYTSPTVVNAMYSALSRLGFEQGRVLEPSVGVGNFFGMMPSSMRNHSDLHGVELDILTSQIVSALYPSAKISKATGFQNYGMPAGYFDVVIGNPPFGRQILADEKGSAFSGWTIHNYFFAKSIEMLRPGGIMPMVVSHNFLDKLDPHVRQWISRRAELVSGVRLPNSAFKENANTEVVTDVLIFKRLDYEHTLGKQEAPDWLETTNVPIENAKTGEIEKLAINNYFLNNPQNVLGINSAAGNMYAANEYTVLPNGDLEEQLSQWVDSLPQSIYVPLVRSATELESSAVEVPEFVKEGSFYMQGAEVWQRLPDLEGTQRASKWEAPNKRAMERMTGMIEIRDALRLQMKYERAASGVTLEMIEENRAKLNQLYENFQKNNGYLNDPVNRRIFLDDTESALVQALEFDYEKSIGEKKAEDLGIEARSATAVKADIFKTRVLFPPGEVEVVQTAKDALLHSLNQTGSVDMEYMQEAYGKSETEIVEELGDLLFFDPVNGLVTADLYLSGDVKTKLKEAVKAAADDSKFSRNVEALKEIQPQDKLPSEIHVTPGSSWVPDSIFSEFAREITGGDAVYHYIPATGQWLGREVNRPDMVKNHVEFGTQKMGGMQILGLLMNSRAPEIKEKVDGKYVTDQPATEAVRQKADKIRAHWDSWIWADPDRAEKLSSIYNDKFNRTVERKYDGSHLTFPGMSPAIKLLAHQKNGVWRGLQDRTILLDQVVGAGKTYEGIAMLMEMRRLGITKKPLIAVPNHLTLQWRSDFYRLYPGANVLAATPQDFEKDNREKFFSKVVTGNWDAVIVGHSSLKKIPVPLEAETKIIKEQYDDISEAIENLKRARGDKHVIKDMETIKINLASKISRLKEKSGEKDDVVDFEDLGVDTLFVDEMHEFKNLFFTTQMNRVSGLGNPAGSGKAFDMFVKIRWLRETYGENSPLITATGTPVSNSLAEMFTMQRYMQYDKLKENNLHVFDAWAKQYGDVQTVYEVAPSGNGYRLSQRFAKFKNLSSLMGEYRSFADVVTLDDLKAQEAALQKSFPVPQIEGGKPLNVVANRSLLQEKFFGTPEIVRDKNDQISFSVGLDSPIKIGQLENGKFTAMRLSSGSVENGSYQNFGGEFDTEQEAAYAVALGAITPAMHIDPNSIVGQFENLPKLVKESNGMINALSLTTQANKAGLDYRLINPSAPDFEGSKVNQAIERIFDIGKKWEEQKGTQLIFCDLSVPLSAKAKMASKEKRIYVRDDYGNITSKTGTLHSLKDNSSVAYFLVADGKGKSKTFTIYDSHTGQLMKNGLDSKSDAHDFVKDVFKDEDRSKQWNTMLERTRHITADEIDEYKNENAIDNDTDTIDQEISLHDVEGVTGGVEFSIYDDMKAKLIAKGVPSSQIEFIHDHDTPQSKAFLFKRVNDGDVRYLFGSTPKMGAGTNVQKRLVALHHIDAPWRPSDLEQREGRIIRRGNSLYERDPEGFRIEINRYATSQTYDTRRWQLLEHKASGVEQLRKYSGANEIEDVATEAANSADMKAAASGNPLILKETQLSNEVKKLKLLYRAHNDGEFLMNSKMRNERYYAEKTGPEYLEKLKAAKISFTESSSSGIIGKYDDKTLHNKEDLADAMQSIGKSLSASNNLKVINYRGLDFGFKQDHAYKRTAMMVPVGDSFLMDSFSPTGAVTRMNNWCESIDKMIDSTEKRIAHSASLAKELQDNVGKPFPQFDLLSEKIEEHGKIQRALMKSNSVAAVKPEDAVEFKAAVDLQKQKLRAYGLGAAVDELEKSEDIENRDGIAAYIKQERADLVDEVDSVMQEATEEIRFESGASLAPAESEVLSSVAEVGAGSKEAQNVAVNPDVPDWSVAADVMKKTRAYAPQRVYPNETSVLSFIESGWNGVREQYMLERKRIELANALDVKVEKFRLPGSMNMQLRIVNAPEAVRNATLGDVANWVPRAVNVDSEKVAVDAPVVDVTAEIVFPSVMQSLAAAEALETAEVVKPAGGLSALDDVKARMVDVLPVDVPDGWILMNAPRPLLGQKTMEGDFVSGRHYAALDPTDSMTHAYLKENVELDARVLVVVPREMQMEVALHGNEYRDKYMEVEVGQRYEMLSSHLEKLRDLPYGKLSKAIVEAKGVASEGLHCGKVLRVVAGVVTQKVDRTGTNVHHDLSKLSLSVKPGDVVDISYRDGKGMVSIAGKEISAGR